MKVDGVRAERSGGLRGVRAMILAAGVGSRLDPLTANLPKPMVPIVNRPAMEHILALLAHHGVGEVVANLWYRPDSILDYFGDGRRFGMSLTYSREKELLGTAGGVKRVAEFFSDTFLVIAGDALTDIDLTSFLAFHRERQALATIALRPVPDPRHFGVVVTDRTGRITGFQEKPEPHEALSLLANTGIYLFQREILDLIPTGEFYDFGKQLFPRLVEEGKPFYGYRMDGYWCDVGTLKQYRLAHQDVLQGAVRLYTPGVALPREDHPLVLGQGAKVSPQALIQGRVVVGDGARIAARARLLGDVVLGPGAVVGEGAVVEASVIWGDAVLERGCRVSQSVIGQGCRIEPGAMVGEGSILSDTCVVEAAAEVAAGSILRPGEVVRS
ncbi:MAG: sugar phosphate nucleotidyltransferase [Betaproteobacteria bacterium]